MARDNSPLPAVSPRDAANFRYPTGGGLEPHSMAKTIGGTHRVSTAIDCEQALNGAYQPIETDMTPGAGAGGEYFPRN